MIQTDISSASSDIKVDPVLRHYMAGLLHSKGHAVCQYNSLEQEDVEVIKYGIIYGIPLITMFVHTSGWVPKNFHEEHKWVSGQ